MWLMCLEQDIPNVAPPDPPAIVKGSSSREVLNGRVMVPLVHSKHNFIHLQNDIVNVGHKIEHNLVAPGSSKGTKIIKQQIQIKNFKLFCV